MASPRGATAPKQKCAENKSLCHLCAATMSIIVYCFMNQTTSKLMYNISDVKNLQNDDSTHCIVKFQIMSLIYLWLVPTVCEGRNCKWRSKSKKQCRHQETSNQCSTRLLQDQNCNAWDDILQWKVRNVSLVFKICKFIEGPISLVLKW